MLIKTLWHKIAILSLFLLLPGGCLSSFNKRNLLTEEFLPSAIPMENLDSQLKSMNLIPAGIRDPRTVSAIILHSTEKKKLAEYLKLSYQNQFMIHILIDATGKIFTYQDFLKKTFVASPGIDELSVHVAYEGTQDSLLSNRIQYESLVRIIEQLANDLNLPRTNQNIILRKGIFTHNQAKRRFGGFVDFSTCGGESVIQSILKDINGKYYEEDHWIDRYEAGWVLKKENKEKLQESFNPTNGRGISKPNKVQFSSIESSEAGFPIESYRIRYTHRGKINPSCIVLHYTAIPDYFQSLKTLESRNLTASLMVDKDGKAYQLIDVLEDRAAAATGTNDNCIQIEIIARDTAELLAQPAQIEKVKTLVLDLSTKYKIPLTNLDIASFSGIFSHTQAKKKWGGSIFLNAKDFDPGEEYMELILNSIGGKYFPETHWKNRDSADWAILFRNFQP